MTIYNIGRKKFFTENEISGSVADACLVDLRINNFTFNGIPRITTNRNSSDEKYKNSEDFGSRDTFKVTLTLENATSSIDLSYAEARDNALRYKNKEDVDNHLFKLIQAALQELEASTSRSTP